VQQIPSIDLANRDNDESLIELERRLEDIKSANTNATSSSRRLS
jgi:hypothetical protein